MSEGLLRQRIRELGRYTKVEMFPCGITDIKKVLVIIEEAQKEFPFEILRFFHITDKERTRILFELGDWIAKWFSNV